MNLQVHQLLEQAKAKAEASKRQILLQQQEERNQHLISLGLIDESTLTRTECGSLTPNAVFDELTDKYYILSNAALPVSDEEYAEICKYYPPTTVKSAQKSITANESLLNTVANIAVGASVGGGLCVIIFSFTSRQFDVLLFSSGMWCIVTALFAYGIAKVLIQISLSLKQK